MIEWLIDNWQNIAIPAVSFLATCVVGLWLRKALGNVFERWTVKSKLQGSHLTRMSIQRPILFWFLLLGVAIGVQVSVLSADIKNIVARLAGSLFVLSLGWAVIVLCERLLKAYLPRIKASRPTIIMVINTIRIIVILIVLLVVLELWGTPTTPILLIVAVVVLAIVFALRSAAPNFFAGLQLDASKHIKVGNYIKLETGEEGYVTKINWNNTQIKTLDDSIVVVPNNKLIQHKVVNFGRPLKKALETFHFFSRMYLPELTGLQAKNLREFVDIIKKAPDSVINYHTHHFLEEHHYLTPEPSNDFGVWITDALGEEVLGERIASVNAFEFPTLGALRERFIGILEEHLAKSYNSRETMTGREFYFIKSVAVILPTPYFAHDLREFVEILHKISLGSLYFHVFESRLKLGNGLNDFSVWMRDSLGEDELGEKIARFDPFTCTLEGLRLTLIQLIEKRLK